MAAYQVKELPDQCQQLNWEQTDYSGPIIADRDEKGFVLHFPDGQTCNAHAEIAGGVQARALASALVLWHAEHYSDRQSWKEKLYPAGEPLNQIMLAMFEIPPTPFADHALRLKLNQTKEQVRQD